MKNIVKTVSLLTIISLIPAAFATTTRVGMINKTASSRLPSIAGRLISSGATTTSSTTSYLGDQECLDKYTDCIKGTDVCGANLEECTTRVLFHAQMPKCLNVLYQCSAAGVNQLFGTSSISALSNATYKTVGGAQEVDDYTYPAEGSALYIMIDGAAQANKLTKDQCVRRYTNCLKRDDICGEEFELCTTATEFRKQAILCDSTLSRCDSAGKTELFDSVANADSLTPGARLAQMIEDGAGVAATNAVVTCEKVVDNCLYNTCVKNPWRCVTGTNTNVIEAADFIAGTPSTINTTVATSATEQRTDAQIRKMFKDQCLGKIGGNKYCHMTYLEKVPSNKELLDVDSQEEVFALAYAARRDAVNTKLKDVLAEFDKEAKDKCIDTIKSCAMRSCGGGIGSVCYKQSKIGSSTTRSTVSSSAYGDVHVNGDNTRGDIKSGCAAIVNADANCQYAAASASTEDSYTYTYTKDSTFDTLFPVYGATNAAADPIGAVSTLNALLATSYNEAAIAKMQKQCESVALSCVRSLCGEDYINCYRARTDIASGAASTYKTGATKLDNSMNKMGGLLDYNIVLGLCMNTVTEASVCEEHLKVAAADWRSENSDSTLWGNGNGGQYSSVGEAWGNANSTKATTQAGEGQILIGCKTNNHRNKNGREINSDGKRDKCDNNEIKECGTVDAYGCLYDQEEYQSREEYVLTQSTETLFQKLLASEERKVQAEYNAKLTKERNICINEGHGGVMTVSDNGSTFMWVKLNNKTKIPANYANNGLSTRDFTASNDLYGSFCRVKVTVMSDDKDIQEGLGDSATAYFATGDTFTCGSWIKSETLQKISETVGQREVCKQGLGKWENGKCNDQKASAKVKAAYAWATVAPALVGGVAGFAGMDALQNKGASLGGLLSGKGVKKTEKSKDLANDCLSDIETARAAFRDVEYQSNQANASAKFKSAVDSANKARNNARSAGIDLSDISAFEYARGYDAQKSATKWYLSGTDYGKFVTAANNFKQAGYFTKDDQSLDVLDDLYSNGGDFLDVQESANAMLLLYKGHKTTCLNGTNTEEKKKFCEIIELPESVQPVGGNFEETQKEQLVKGTKEYNDFSSKLDKLENACQDASDPKNDKRLRNNLIAGGVTAAATAALGAGITASVIKTKKENIKNEAAQEWMETIGDHIQCYVGSEQVGTYGDPVAVEIE